MCGNGVLKARFMRELACFRMVAGPSFLNEPLAWSLGFGRRRIVLGAPFSSIAIKLFAIRALVLIRSIPIDNRRRRRRRRSCL